MILHSFDGNFTSKDEDFLNATPKDPDILVLLMVIAVLSTLLIVVILACFLWSFYKFCPPPIWLNKPNRWFKRNKKTFRTYSKDQRDIIEMNDFMHEDYSPTHQSNKVNHPFVPERTGISERLGYGRDERLAEVPYLPPPRSWTPSPPFIPDGPIPSKPQPIRPDPRLFDIQRKGSLMNDNMTFGNVKSHPKIFRDQQCYYCGHSQNCAPVFFDSNINPPKRKQQRLLRTRFCLSNNSSAVKNTSNVNLDKTSNERTQSELAMSNLNKSYSEHLNHYDVVTSKDHEKTSYSGYMQYFYNNEKNPLKYSSENFHSTTQDPTNTGMFRSTYNSHGAPCNKKSFSSHTGFGTINKCYSKINRRRSQTIDRDLYFHYLQGGQIRNEGPADRDICPTKCKATEVRRKKKHRESIMMEKPKTGSVFIESPSSSSSSCKKALNRSPKKYWKIYHHPRNVSVSNHTRANYGEETIARDDDIVSDVTPSMSWDHLTPDPSPIHDVDSQHMEKDTTDYLGAKSLMQNNDRDSREDNVVEEKNIKFINNNYLPYYQEDEHWKSKPDYEMVRASASSHPLLDIN